MQVKERGFTLIELLIVVAIIAILAAIAIPRYANYRARAVRASMVSDARQVATALDAYYVDEAAYPTTAATNGTVSTAGGSGTVGPGTTAPAQTIQASNGNTIATTSTTSTYSIAVTNTSGNAGGYTGPVTLTNAGACTWASGQNC